MEKLNRCFRIHFDFLEVEELDLFLSKLLRMGNLTIVNDQILIWLDDDWEKCDLVKTLRKNKIKDFFCEPIEYDNIKKGNDFDFVSSWFLDNYKVYSLKQIEKNEQENLRQMYNNIEKAKQELKQRQECLKDSEDKNINGGSK